MLIHSHPIIPDSDVFVIAELGVNHDGSPQRALDLTNAAADAGANAVKLQLFKTDLLMSKAAKLAAYQKAAGESDPIAMLQRLEFSIDDMAPIVSLAHSRGLAAIVTVFSTELVPIAEQLPWDAYKTASPDIIHKPLLEALAATGKPLIVSTGASTLPEVARAVHWIHDAGAADRLALMQCVSAYPTPVELASLWGMLAIREIFRGPVGYSDHTPDTRIGLLAAHYGAELLEKHLTYDRTAQGPDHSASLDPAQMAEYIAMARRPHVKRFLRRLRESAAGLNDANATELLGEVEHVFNAADRAMDPRAQGAPIVKEVLDIERDVRTASRQSLTTRRALRAGHTLTRNDLTIKRPGTGLEPYRLDEVLGSTLTHNLEADVPLTAPDIAR